MLKDGAGSVIRLNDSNKVVLMAHGFRGTPDNLGELGQLLFDEGYSVFNVRLPGHGLLDEAGILDIKLRDWITYIENLYLELAAQYDELYLCGLSLGSALLMLADSKYCRAKKIAAISPMLKLKPMARFLSPILRHFKKKIKGAPVDCSIQSEDLFKGFIDFVPIPQVDELRKLSNMVRRALSRTEQDVLCFLSRKDNVVSFNQTHAIVSKYPTFKTVILEESYHNSIIDVDKDLIIDKILKYFRGESNDC